MSIRAPRPEADESNFGFLASDDRLFFQLGFFFAPGADFANYRSH